MGGHQNIYDQEASAAINLPEDLANFKVTDLRKMVLKAVMSDGKVHFGYVPQDLIYEWKIKHTVVQCLSARCSFTVVAMVSITVNMYFPQVLTKSAVSHLCVIALTALL